MPEPIIHIQGLSKRFGNIHALTGLNMQVAPGDIYGFLGPNGSGKSTTIRILMSLVRADGGSAKVFGMPVESAGKRIRARIGALIERPDFYGHLPARTNLSMLARYSGFQAGRKEIFEVLEMVGLKGRENDRVRAFSDGMKQRLGIAQAMLHRPDLLILDEPFNSLDPQGVKDVRDLILTLNREKKVTVMISTHQLDEIEKLATRLVVISRGKTIAEGSMSELLKQRAARVKVRVDHTTNALKALKDSQVVIEKVDEAERVMMLSCPVTEVPVIGEMLVHAGVRLYELKPDRSLESLFLDYTAES